MIWMCMNGRDASIRYVTRMSESRRMYPMFLDVREWQGDICHIMNGKEMYVICVHIHIDIYINICIYIHI